MPTAAICCAARRWRRWTRRGCKPSSKLRFVSTACHAPSAPTTGCRSLRRGWRDCRGWRWGERIALLPRDERWYTVYFAHLPLGNFDSWQRRVLPLPKAPSFYIADAGDGDDCSPSPAPLPLTEREQRL